MFGRVLTAILTPMTEDGELDYERVWRLAEYLVGSGSEGIVVCGTTGESPTLKEREKVALFKTVVDAVGSRASVIAGTGTYDTRESMELTERAAEVGCTGVMAVTPYYSRPPQEGLIAHFTAIADASELPVLLYNIPSRTGRLIELNTVARLAEHEQIVGIKDAVGDLTFTSKTRLMTPDDFVIYSGDDINTLPMMAVGAIGVVSVAAHLAGKQVAAMVAAAAEGRWDEARELHLRLVPLVEALFVEPNPIPVKGAMNALWEPVGEPRLPLIPAQDDTLQQIKEALGTVQRA